MPDVSACPANPPPPSGYTVWKGKVPPDLTKWAMTLRDHIAKYPLHTIWWSDPDVYPELVMARSDSHSWTYKPGIGLVTGICIRGITLYRAIQMKGLRDQTDVILDPETAIPSPDLAVYDPPDAIQSTNWGLVALTGGVIVATLIAFAAAIRYAGKPTVSSRHGRRVLRPARP